MQNWDDEINDIMRRKMENFGRRNNVQSNTNRVAFATPLTLSDRNFTEAVNKYQLLIVDFWAPWCGPCRMVSPIIEQLASELAGKVVFGKLNVDDNPNVSNAFGIQSIPTIVIFKNGQAVDAFTGAASKQQMISKISKYIDVGVSSSSAYDV